MDKNAIDKRISELLMVLNSSHTKSDLGEHVLDVIPELFSLLKDEAFSQQPEMVAACMELIELLPEVCPPKEVIIALLDQAYGFKDDVHFRALLRPIGKSIQRLDSNKYHSLDLAAENLYDHLASLALPQDKQDLVETLVSGSSPSAEKISLLAMAFLEFLEPFAKELSWLDPGSSADARSPVQKHVQSLTTCLIKVLDRPLGYLNLSVTEPKSISCLCGEHCIRLISQLQPNFIKAFKEILEKNDTIARTVKHRKAEKERSPQNCLSEDMDASDEEETDVTELLVPQIGLAVGAYLIFDQRLYFQSLPRVYTAQYLFEINRRFVITLLKTSHSQLIYKGMRLHLCLLDNIPVKTLDSNILQCDETQELLRSIINTTISCKVKELNQLAIILFKKFLSSFERSGRTFLLNFVSQSYSQSNVQAYIAKLVKDEICECLDNSEQTDKSYAAMLLKKFLDRFFSYKPSPKGSLLEEGDRILASLNLLRYLVIRDKPCRNSTGIWTHVPVIEENFLKTLGSELQVMQSFVQDRMRVIRDGGQPTSNVDDLKYDVTIGNDMLENLTPEQQMETLHSAWSNLDMIESVLIRVKQLIGEEKQGLAA